MKTAILFHDGCDLCLEIATTIADLMSANHYQYESVNLGIDKTRGQEAAAIGVKKLPSLVINGRVLRLEDHSPIEHYL